MDKSVFEIIVFGDKCLLEQPVEEWPVVDCLIAFYSTGYPLNKAQEYVVNCYSNFQFLKIPKKKCNIISKDNFQNYTSNITQS